jgi:hypothetical protein
MRAKFINEAIKHLTPKSEEEIQDLEKRGFKQNTGKWQFNIDIKDIVNAYDNDEDTENYRQAMITRLKSKINDVALVVDEDEVMDFEDIVSDFEMLDPDPEVDEIDWILDKLYDWADHNNIWIESF